MPSAKPIADPILYRKIAIPPDFLVSPVSANISENEYAGDLRIGDLTGNGKADYLVYRCEDDAMKPCFIGAFDQDGQTLWHTGAAGEQPARPGPIAIHDIDADGKAEVICFFMEPNTRAASSSMENVLLQIRDGATGQIKTQAAPDQIRACRGQGSNWLHQRILIAHFRGTSAPQDFLVKLGETLLAFNDNLELLWSYSNPWIEHGKCPAYIPAVGDINSDGRDEVNGGYFLLDHNGQPLWEAQLAPNMDSVAILPWDNGNMRAFCSGSGHIVDQHGRIILKLGQNIVPHGQELRVATFTDDFPSPQMVIRYDGHKPDVILVSNAGEIVSRFKLNDSPNNTGMEVVCWDGPREPAILYNGGMLWKADGSASVALPQLPPPLGPANSGWYHCIPANICGDGREEIAVYNPWDKFIYVYTPAPLNESAYSGYLPGPRQFNPRLMD